MDLDKLRAALAKDGPKPVYILQGTEQLLIDEAQRLILSHAVADPGDHMAVTHVDLAEGGTDARDVVAAARAIGLFVSRIAVVVRSVEVLDAKPRQRDEVARYLADPVRACALILRVSPYDPSKRKSNKNKPKLDGKSALVKRAKRHGQVLSFDEMKPWQAARWLQDRAGGLGNGLDNGTARLVVDLVGTNLLVLHNTLEQLSLYVGPGEPIRGADVERLLAATRSHTVFELTDAVGARDPTEALTHLHAMMQREAPLAVFGGLNRQFGRLSMVLELRDRGQRPDAIARSVGMHPFVAKKLYEQSTRFDRGILRMAMERLYATDLALKSSRMSGALLLERLVLDLCGVGRRRLR